MLLSIIIPVYNSEKYILDCLNSILSQTITDYECILIDDCSTDNSALIIQEFITRTGSSKFRYVKNEKNIRQGLTRNYGVLLAQGKFLMFMDNDDIIPPKALECLLVNSDRADMVVGNFARFIDGTFPHQICWQSSITSQNFYIAREESFSNLYNLVYPWAKIYNREFWLKNNFKYTRNRYEDTILWSAIASRAVNIVICPAVIYWHRIGNHLSDGSIVPTEFEVYYNSLMARLKVLKEYDLLNNDNYYKVFCLADAYQIIQDAMFFWQRYKLFRLLISYIPSLPCEKIFNSVVIPEYKIRKLKYMYKYKLLYFILKPKSYAFKYVYHNILGRNFANKK